MMAHRIAQGLCHVGERVPLGLRGGTLPKGVFDPPVRVDLPVEGVADAHPLTGLQGTGSGVEGRRARDRAPQQESGQSLRVDFAKVHDRADRANLGCEGEPSVLLGVVERLDSERVACEEELAFHRVPDAESEHAAESIDNFVAPPPVTEENHLGIAVRQESLAERLELAAELEVVVDLAVEGDRQVAVGGRLGLVAAGREIDDREAAVGESD